jgi:DHA1 family bicyclomycin/chloramphenicol resistance-like MFS transporter
MSTGQTPRYRATPKYVLMLGAMSALGALSTDMYLPNLPNVATDLRTSALLAQLTIVAMMVGAAAGQLVVGPLSDHFGRRRPALLGAALHVITSGLCAMAPAIAPLIGLRVAMGFCNAAASVVGMAIIRDRFVGRDAAQLMSRLMLVIGVAPLFAPTIGSVIGDWVGWRGVFGALALYGLGLFVAIWAKLPETLPAQHRVAHVGHTWRGYPDLLRDRHFLALAVIPGLMQAVMMSYIVGSPVVLRDGYGLTPMRFSLVFAVNGVGLIGGAQVNAALVKHVTSARVLRVALPISAALAIWLAVVGATGLGGLPLLLVSLFAVMALNNVAPPNASALALSRHGEKAGTAAACIGFLQGVIPALVSPCVGLLGENAGAMGAVMAFAALAALGVLTFGTPVYRRGGAAHLDRVATLGRLDG